MIERYTRPEMGALWSEQRKYDNWLLVELAVLRAHEAINPFLPKGSADVIESKCKGHIDPKRINQIESEVQHDVIAFTTHIAELAGEPANVFHLGLTSSDVLDTALALTIKESGKLIAKGIKELLNSLKKKAIEYASLPIMGRTHGVHAEPTTLGLKLALCWDEIKRGGERLKAAIAGAAVGKVSGAVGNYTQIHPLVETHVGVVLGLSMAPISSQIVTRDRHAALLCAMAVLAGSLERFATEVRLLQHTEIGELAEPFAKGQKGSSAMPHKRNPIVCERMSGLARLLRSYAQTAMENQVLWHERDISHSSAERVIFPDSFCLLDYMLERSNWLVNGLVVNKKRIQANLALTPEVYHSQSLLLYLIGFKNMSREESYELVQRASFLALEKNRSLKEIINEVLPVPIPAAFLDEVFSPEPFSRNAIEILKRLWKR